MHEPKSPPWWRDSKQTASGEAGAIQQAILLGVSLLAGSSACWAGNELDQYSNQLKGAREARNQSGLGDQIGLQSGSLSFSYTDVSVRTNSGLAMAVGRKLDTNAAAFHTGSSYGAYTVDDYDGVQNGQEPQKDAFGYQWELDIPYVSGTFDTRTGWISENGGPNGTDRCTGFGPPTSRSGIYPNYYSNFKPRAYWSGNNVNIPGRGEESMLSVGASPTIGADGTSYYATTKSNWRASCLTTIKNGPGQGFKISLPDGTKYTFDWMATHRRPSLMPGATGTSLCNPSVGCSEGPNGTVLLPRTQVFLYVTQVADRFGNTLTYDYDPVNPNRLRSIVSSDGASINLTYSTDGQITSISSGTQTWTYVYGTGTGRTIGQSLNQVIEPDGSKWTYQIPSISPMHAPDLGIANLYKNCIVNVGDMQSSQPAGVGDSISLSVTSPAGLTGQFDLRKIVHGTNNTPGGCSVNPYNQAGNLSTDTPALAYAQVSLAKQTLSGPGVPSRSWQYTYQPTWSWSSACAQAGACAATSKTIVTAPNLDTTEYTFGNDYQINSGQLLITATKSSDSVELQRVASDFLLSAQGQNFSDANGLDINPGNNPLSSKNRPLTRTATTQQATVFARSVNQGCGQVSAYCFDGFARELSATEASTYTDATLNQSRTVATEYFDDTTRWVLGQVARTVVNGQEASRTSYNAASLPAAQYEFGMLKKSVGYAADGTVATISDGNGNATNLSGWKRGVPQLVKYPGTAAVPAGASQAAIVDGNGWITSVTDENGFTTGYTYDPMGRITSTIYPSGDSQAWSPTYQASTQVWTDEYGLAPGHWVTTKHTGNGYLVTYFDALAHAVLTRAYDSASVAATSSFTRYGYDSLGRRSFESYPGTTDVLSTGTHFSFDSLGRITTTAIDSELGLLQETREYLPGFQTRVTNARGNAITTTYQTFDSPSTDAPLGISLPENAYTTITRDVFGKPKSISRSGLYLGSSIGATRYYVYDANARLCKTINPESGATIIEYDAADNVLWSAEGQPYTGSATTCDRSSVAASQKTTRIIDAMNRVTQVSTPGGVADVATTYAPDGKVMQLVTHNPGTDIVTNTYTYLKRGVLSRETVQVNTLTPWTFDYVYDGNGNLSSQTYPGALVVGYAPDALGRPSQVGTFASGVTYYLSCCRFHRHPVWV